MRKRLYLTIFILMITTLAVLGGRSIKVAALDSGKTYTFTLNATISGQTGDTLNYEATLDLGSAKLVRSISAGTDISGWFSGEYTPLPAGITVTVKEDAAKGAGSIKLLFSGTVYGASPENIKMTVQNIYFDANEANWYSTANVNNSGTAKFNITRSFSAPAGYERVGTAIFFKKTGDGFVLSGKKNEPLSGATELDVVIEGCFLTSFPANYNISSWFTGEIYEYNELLNTTRTSRLPEGVTARIKNAVKPGDNSFTIVFSGTPTKGSRDFIAFSIPQGTVTSRSAPSDRGDSQGPCKVANYSGVATRYVYDIKTDDLSELYSEVIKITYPDVQLEAGLPVTASDNVIVTLEICGRVNNADLEFTNIEVGKSTLRGICWQTPGSGWYNDYITTYTGLTGTVISVSTDKKTLQVRLTGTPKKPLSNYPFELGAAGFVLHPSYNSAGHKISGVLAGENTMSIVAPTLNATVDKNVTIVKATEDRDVTVTNGDFTINLGPDTFATDMPVGTELPLFYRHSESTRFMSDYNGIRIKVISAVKQGDHTAKVRIYINKSEIYKFKGYLKLCLPKSYITRMKDYGAAGVDFYDIADSRIYVDINPDERTWWSVTGFAINGTVKCDSVWDPNKGRYILTPYAVGKGKVYFSIDIDWTVFVKEYEAGASVLDLVRLGFHTPANERKRLPLAWPDPSDPRWPENKPKYIISPDFEAPGTTGSTGAMSYYLYDIVTVEPITRGTAPEGTIRTLKLMIDLSNVYAVSDYYENGFVYFNLNRNSDAGWVMSGDVVRYRLVDPNYPPSGGTGAAENDGIDYSAQQDVIIYAADSEGNAVENVSINMTQEKLVTDFAYKWYSVDGGSKWKEAKSPLTDKQFQSMLNKGMTLWLADSYDKKAKALTEDAVVYKFAKIEARPKAPKLKVEYATYADDTGATAGQWGLALSTLAPIDATTLASLEIGAALADKKSVSEKGYGLWPTEGGLAVPELSGGKVQTSVYYVRVRATESTPSSKLVKVSVKGQQKAPNLKADYKKELIKLKDGMTIYFGDTAPFTLTGVEASASSYDDYEGRIIHIDSKDAAKNGVSLSCYLTGTRNTVLIWTNATAKKPASAVQEIKLAARATIDAQILTVSKGKATLDKKYEVYDEVKKKWGSLPKVTSSCELKIRLKATAKGGKEDDSSFAASDWATLKINYGVWDADKKKSGITAAEIVTE